MDISLMAIEVFFSLEVFTTLIAPEWSFRFLSQVSNLIMPRQSFFPRVGLVASNDLTSVDRFVSVTLCMPLQVLLPSESLVAFSTTIDTFHFLSFPMAFQVVVSTRVHLTVFSYKRLILWQLF